MGKILVADDEDDVRLSLERRLKRDGHGVTIAASEAGAAAAIEAAPVPFDVVLTDMLMESPNSGVEVLKSALARDVFTEVVVLTAYGNVTNAVECMKMGAFDYVEKNIPGVDVYELISIKNRAGVGAPPFEFGDRAAFGIVRQSARNAGRAGQLKFVVASQDASLGTFAIVEETRLATLLRTLAGKLCKTHLWSRCLLARAWKSAGAPCCGPDFLWSA